MTAAKPKVAISPPRWDGSRVLFEIVVGGQRVACAISRGALQDVVGRRHFASADLLRGFMGARERIERIAVGMFTARPESVSGVVSIWADDIDDAPTAAVAIGSGRTTHAGP